MEKRDIYLTMVLFAILIALSVASGEISIKQKRGADMNVTDWMMSKK